MILKHVEMGEASLSGTMVEISLVKVSSRVTQPHEFSTELYTELYMELCMELHTELWILKHVETWEAYFLKHVETWEAYLSRARVARYMETKVMQECEVCMSGDRNVMENGVKQAIIGYSRLKYR